MRSEPLRLVHGNTGRRKSYREAQTESIAEDLYVAIRNRLRRTGHWPQIRLCKMRAVIDAPFMSARVREGIVTFRYLDPIILPLDEIETITRASCVKHTSEYVFARLKLHARRYARSRKAVKHLKWKE